MCIFLPLYAVEMKWKLTALTIVAWQEIFKILNGLTLLSFQGMTVGRLLKIQSQKVFDRLRSILHHGYTEGECSFCHRTSFGALSEQ